MIEVGKKLLIFVFCILFIVSIGRDLTTGTFPKSAAQQPKQAEDAPKQQTTGETKTTENKRYRTVQHKVVAGETVLTIIKKLNVEGPPVTIQQMIQDFKTLNPNVEPHNIQTSQIYTFPIYRQNENRL